MGDDDDEGDDASSTTTEEDGNLYVETWNTTHEEEDSSDDDEKDEEIVSFEPDKEEEDKIMLAATVEGFVAKGLVGEALMKGDAAESAANEEKEFAVLATAAEEPNPGINLSVVVSFDNNHNGVDDDARDDDDDDTKEEVGDGGGEHSFLNLSVVVSPSSSLPDWDDVVEVPFSPSDLASPLGSEIIATSGTAVVEEEDDDGINGQRFSLMEDDWDTFVEGATSPASYYSNKTGHTDKYEIALNAKDQGNASFLKGDYRGAIDSYTKAEDLLREVLPSGDDGYVHETDRERVDNTKVEMSKVLGNVAVCHLRLKEWPSAVTYATMALEVDPENERARFHLAKAFFELENYVDAIDNAVRVRHEKAERLVSQARSVLHSIVQKYEDLFRCIIDSYRLRMDDEYHQLGEDQVSVHSLYGLHAAERDSGKIPVHHFRAYIRMGVSRHIIPQFVIEEDTMLQAIVFMALSDEFSNLAYPVTGYELEAYQDIAGGGTSYTVPLLRKFAADIKGPLLASDDDGDDDDKSQSLSKDMEREDDEEVPSWHPTPFRYSCSCVSV